MSVLLLRIYSGERVERIETEDSSALIEETLMNYQKLGEVFLDITDEELKAISRNHQSGRELDFWDFINGPLTDSLTHVGQITSWRRIAGNPQVPGVNPFLGIRMGS